MEHEQLFPGRQTYARYLHVAEAVAEDEAQAAWDGLGGRLKALRREVATGQAEAKANVADMSVKLDAVEAKLEAKLEAGLAGVNAEMADMKADMVDMKAEVKADMADMKAEVKADMADMKALLEQLVARR